MNRRTTLFILWTVQGILAALWLALLPGDSDHGLLLGFSASRLGLMGAAFALAGISAFLAWTARRTEAALRPALRDALSLLSIIAVTLAPTIVLILYALGQTSGFTYTAYAERLTPLACWFLLSGVEFLAWTAWEGRHAISDTLQPASRLFSITFYVILSVAGILAFMLVTRLGLSPTHDGSWGNPATPLLEWQILLALMLGLLFVLFSPRWKWLPRRLRQDRWILFLIYLFTCLLWLSQPVNPGWFATPPRAPNFQIYPYSDALIYAQYAQSALIGNGFLWPDVPTRPLYIAFLTWLHAVAGQDYSHVIVLQTLVLAAFPAALYLLGKELGGHPLGIGLALLATLRDLTANVAAPFANNYTYSKLFFSELPAALLIVLFTLMALRWMRNAKPPWYALLAGGVLGLCSLVRLQSIVLWLVVVPVGFFVIRNRKKWALGATLMVFGAVLTFAPWLVRNALATGGLVFDNPISQSMVLARRWSGDNGNDLIPQQPGETTAHYANRMNGIALDNLRRDPGHILGSAANHFFNNEVGNLLVFPLRDQLQSSAELIWPQHAFWQSWNSQPTTGQFPVIFFYLLLLALGVGTAVYKNGLPGLLPLGLSLAYNAWTGLFLSSGDRFLVPLDWAAYLYLFLGLLTLASLLLVVLQGARENVAAWICARYHGDPSNGEMGPVSWRRLALTAACVLSLGACVPLTELAFPKITPKKIAALQAPAGEIVLYGRAIYPRYYKAGEGEPGSAKLGYGKSNEARLVFYLLGDQNTLVILPLKTAPAFFPNTSDVTVIGRMEDGFVNADKIVVKKGEKTAKYVP